MYDTPAGSTRDALCGALCEAGVADGARRRDSDTAHVRSCSRDLLIAATRGANRVALARLASQKGAQAASIPDGLAAASNRHSRSGSSEQTPHVTATCGAHGRTFRKDPDWSDGSIGRAILDDRPTISAARCSGSRARRPMLRGPGPLPARLSREGRSPHSRRSRGRREVSARIRERRHPDGAVAPRGRSPLQGADRGVHQRGRLHRAALTPRVLCRISSRGSV